MNRATGGELRERLLAEAGRREAVPSRVPTMNPAMRFAHPERLRDLLSEAAAALSPAIAPAGGGPTLESCWLVELFLPFGGNSLGFYHTGFTHFGGNASRTTASPHEAKRYASKEDAERIAATLESKQGEWRAIEHGFYVDALPAALTFAAPQDGEAKAEKDCRACQLLSAACGYHERNPPSQAARPGASEGYARCGCGAVGADGVCPADQPVGGGWQPMDTAPREGRFIGLVGSRATTVEAGRHYVKLPHEEGGPTFRDVWNECGDGSITPCWPEGWMPMPALIEASAAIAAAAGDAGGES